MEAFRIRDLLPDEVPALAELAARTYRETFGEDLEEEELAAELEESRSEAYFRDAMRQDTFLVVEVAGSLVGYVQLSDVKVTVRGAPEDLRPRPGDQAVNALYVSKDRQGMGIGRALLHAAFAHERFRKAAAIFIDVWEENRRAVTFYRSYGFQSVGHCDVVMGGEVVGSDLVLRKTVAP